MSPPEIRTAERGMEAGLARVSERSLPSAWSVRAFEVELARPMSRILVALVMPGQVGGYVLGWRVEDEVQILSVAVDPDWRRCGVGEQLLRAYLGRLRAEGVHRVSLEMRASNAPAAALYRKLGLAREGRRSRYYVGGEDAHLFGAAL